MIYIENVKRMLDNEDLKYKSISNNSVAMCWTGKYNNDYAIAIDLVEDEGIGYLEVATGIFIEDITPQIHDKINYLNFRVKWFKFFINNNNQLMMEYCVDLNGVSSETVFLRKIYSATNIIDEIFPDIQRTIWNK